MPAVNGADISGKEMCDTKGDLYGKLGMELFLQLFFELDCRVCEKISVNTDLL